jgi:NitT/TauT family transport system substrate-binding protein
MKYYFKACLFIAFLLFSFLFLTCNRCSTVSENNRIKVGYIPFVTDLPLFVAIENGYFNEQGLVIDALKCGDSNEALNLLLAGKLDVVAHLAFSVFWTADEKSGGNFKLFLPCYESGDTAVSYLLVRKGSPIKTLSEIPGKKIGTITGITQLTYLKLVLENLHLDPNKDVTIIQVPSNLQLQALQSGQYDILFTVDPYGTIGLKNGICSLLQSNPRAKNIVDPFWAAAAAMSKYFLKRKDIADKFNFAMEKAVDFIRNNEQKAKLILIKYTPLESNIANDIGLYHYVKVGEVKDFSKMQDLADKMLKNKLLQKHIDTQSLLLSTH